MVMMDLRTLEPRRMEDFKLGTHTTVNRLRSSISSLETEVHSQITLINNLCQANAMTLMIQKHQRQSQNALTVLSMSFTTAP